MKKEKFIIVLMITGFMTFNSLADELTCAGDENSTCQWQYDENTHTLTITGTGAMMDYGPSESVGSMKTTYWALRPWNAYASEIETVVISGMTTVGNRAFQGMGNLTNVILPDSITSIGQSSFADTPSVESIFLSDSITEIRNAAFGGFWGDIYCPENKKTFCYEEVNNHGRLYNKTVDDALKTYTKESDGRYVLDGVRYKSFTDMSNGQNGLNLKRIYTIDEANAVAGERNTFKIKYR